MRWYRRYYLGLIIVEGRRRVRVVVGLIRVTCIYEGVGLQERCKIIEKGKGSKEKDG